MSHKPTVFSPPGTPLSDRTVGELVAERPSRSRVFQAFRMDFCCQGAKTLAQACEGKGLELATVAAALEAELAGPGEPGRNPADLPPAVLADYIESRHHGFLRSELPRLQAMALRVAHVHGGHTPSLVEVRDVFLGMQAELLMHLQKEEQILFPAIRALAAGQPTPLQLDCPIAVMLREHNDAGEALERLRTLTEGFTPPAGACNTYRALFAGLADLEQDLHRHIHLENAVLFPAAQALAS